MGGEPIIIGLENELAVGVSSSDKRAQVPRVMATMIQVLSRNVPSVQCAEPSQPLPGLMLGNNGARIYTDGPSYLELATPECRTPEQALAYQRATELLVLRALDEAARTCGMKGEDVRLSRIVTDYAPDMHFSGQHLNVLMRRYTPGELVTFLVPFLVTRFYAAAGAWGPTGFVMTHKNRAARCVSSQDTRQERPIVNLKNENLASPQYKRLHLVHGDAMMGDLGQYLTVGCTALVCKMLDDGACVGAAYTLDDPVRALKQLDNDPTWTRPVRLTCGREATGLEIQEHYLKAAEHYTRGNGEPWMHQVVRRWRWAWEALSGGPEQLASVLDPFIKSRMYGQVLAKHGMTLREFGLWCSALALVEPHLDGSRFPRRAIREHLRGLLPMVCFLLLEDRMAKYDMPWDRLPAMRTLLRTLKAMDLQYHDISERGLHWRMRQNGLCGSSVLDRRDIEQAMSSCPKGTRAEARGKAICEVWGNTRARANWVTVMSPTRGRMQLNDPFQSQGQWVAPKKPEAKRKV